MFDGREFSKINKQRITVVRQLMEAIAKKAISILTKRTNRKLKGENNERYETTMV